MRYVEARPAGFQREKNEKYINLENVVVIRAFAAYKGADYDYEIFNGGTSIACHGI